MQRRSDGARLVVGLGNPGREYARTRHNVGFRVAEALVRKWDCGRGKRAFNGRLFKAAIGPEAVQVLLFQPHTFMNRSGWAVQELAAFYKAGRQDLLIVLDDMALPLGQLRFRSGGSAGGHKGLADVLEAFGAERLPRLRVGIGAAPAGTDPADYVLRPFEAGETDMIEQAIEQAAQAVEDWVLEGIEYAMGKYNRRAGRHESPVQGPGKSARKAQSGNGRRK